MILGTRVSTLPGTLLWDRRTRCFFTHARHAHSHATPNLHVSAARTSTMISYRHVSICAKLQSACGSISRSTRLFRELTIASQQHPRLPSISRLNMTTNTVLPFATVFQYIPGISLLISTANVPRHIRPLWFPAQLRHPVYVLRSFSNEVGTFSCTCELLITCLFSNYWTHLALHDTSCRPRSNITASDHHQHEPPSTLPPAQHSRAAYKAE